MIRSLNSKWHGILDARQGKGHYSDIMSNILLDEIDPTNSILYQIFLLGKTLVSDYHNWSFRNQLVNQSVSVFLGFNKSSYLYEGICKSIKINAWNFYCPLFCYLSHCYSVIYPDFPYHNVPLYMCYVCKGHFLLYKWPKNRAVMIG